MNPGRFGRSVVRGLTFAAMAMLPVSQVQSAAAIQSTPNDPVVFTKDIAPILFDRCAICHHPNGSAPFSLLTYDDVRQRASQIAVATKNRFMPPWRAESSGQFVGQYSLTDREIESIQRWVQDGARKGIGATCRNLRIGPMGGSWYARLILPFPAGYTLPSDGADVFRVFVIPVPVDASGMSEHWSSDQVIRGSCTTPTSGSTRRPRRERSMRKTPAQVQRTARDLRRLSRRPFPRLDARTGRAASLPRGLAWRLDPGTDLVVEMHLQPSGKAEEVSPSIGLYFADAPPDRTPAMLRLGRQDIAIGAGACIHQR